MQVLPSMWCESWVNNFGKQFDLTYWLNRNEHEWRIHKACFTFSYNDAGGDFYRIVRFNKSDWVTHYNHVINRMQIILLSLIKIINEHQKQCSKGEDFTSPGTWSDACSWPRRNLEVESSVFFWWMANRQLANLLTSLSECRHIWICFSFCVQSWRKGRDNKKSLLLLSQKGIDICCTNSL